ncbi:MAG: phosphonate C-P lyase system protein PhnH [Mastigocoleus sp. MO_167.B18]|nr:phosphonate C-P lyase system protein PhnH [Mastigocoleus sp. MO_167.B18]
MIDIELEAIWQGSIQQKIFRQLLNCFALPGTIADLSKFLGESPALIGVLAVLLDASVSLNDNAKLLQNRERRLLRAKEAKVSEANFVLVDATHPPPTDFLPNLGTLPSPEQGATLILQGSNLGQGDLSLKLTGPGIPDYRLVKIAGFHPTWWLNRQEWVIDFPLGVDLLLVDRTQVMAVPRTIQLELYS